MIITQPNKEVRTAGKGLNVVFWLTAPLAYEGVRGARRMEMASLGRSALIDLTLNKLGQCTAKQIDLFNRMYPDGIGVLTNDRLINALDQVLRTIVKNESKEI